jgi:hypothetical protein
VKVNGVWRHVYRPPDQHGQVIDVLLSTRRDAAAARRLFTRALRMLTVLPSRCADFRLTGVSAVPDLQPLQRPGAGIDGEGGVALAVALLEQRQLGGPEWGRSRRATTRIPAGQPLTCRTNRLDKE